MNLGYKLFLRAEQKTKKKKFSAHDEELHLGVSTEAHFLLIECIAAMASFLLGLHSSFKLLSPSIVMGHYTG
jgi:hypothetical protein